MFSIWPNYIVQSIYYDYTSHNPGSITKMSENLNLSTFASTRQVLKRTSIFKVVEELVPSLPIDNFLKKARPFLMKYPNKNIKNFKTDSIVERHVHNHP